MPTTRGPESANLHWHAEPPAAAIALKYTVVGDVGLIPPYPEGNAAFGTPRAGQHPKTPAATAFRVASAGAVGGADIATGPARLAFVSYTNSVYGPSSDNRSHQLTYLDTPVWVLVFPVDGSVDISIGGSTARHPFVQSARTGCLVFSIVLADTDEWLTSGEQCDPS